MVRWNHLHRACTLRACRVKQRPYIDSRYAKSVCKLGASVAFGQQSLEPPLCQPGRERFLAERETDPEGWHPRIARVVAVVLEGEAIPVAALKEPGPSAVEPDFKELVVHRGGS